MFAKSVLLKPSLRGEMGVISQECQPVVFQDRPKPVLQRQRQEVGDFRCQFIELFQSFSEFWLYQPVDPFHTLCVPVHSNKCHYKRDKAVNLVRKLRDLLP